MKKILINIDGASRGNPGPSAIAVVFSNEKGKIIKTYSKFLGKRTNNEAEYQSAIFALEKLKLMFGKKLAKETETIIFTDSELLYNQLNRKYKIENSKIQKLFLKLWNLLVELPKVKFRKIPRTKNKIADKLVNQELDKFVK